MIRLCNMQLVFRSIWEMSLMRFSFILCRISKLMSTKNSCCADIKAAFTVGSKCIIKFG